MQSPVLDKVESVRPSVRLSVSRTLVLCQNDASQDHKFSSAVSPRTLVWVT